MVNVFDNLITEEERVFLLSHTTEINEHSEINRTMHRKNLSEKAAPELYQMLTNILDRVLPEPYKIDAVMTFDNQTEIKMHTHGCGGAKEYMVVNLMLEVPPDDRGGTIFFDNYTINCAYSPDITPAQITNYKDEPFPEELRIQNCNFLSPKTVYGLTLSECVTWKPNRIMTFPTTQLHCGKTGDQEKKFIIIHTNLV